MTQPDAHPGRSQLARRSPDAHRDQVEQRANLLRERLLRTIDALDERRHTALSVRGQIERHRIGVELLGASVVLLAGIGVTLALRRARTRGERLRRARLQAITRSWRHPDRIARKERGLLFHITRAVLVNAATAVAMSLARRGVQRARWKLVAPTAGSSLPSPESPAHGGA